MARRPRRDIAGGIHHVMNRGVNRQRVFFGDVDRVEFGRRLADIHERFGVETLAYCLMSNHYHLVLHAPSGGLGAAMQHLGLVYTRRVNDRVGRDGPLFRGRYHSIPIDTEAYLLTAVRYVHRNALDLEGVDRPSDHRWSSHRAYVGLRPTASFLRTGLVLGCFDDRADRFEAFVDDVAPGTIGRLRGDVAEVDDVVQVIRLAIAVDDLQHGDDHRTPRWQERTALIVLADRLGDHALGHRLIDRLSFPSVDARRAAIRRARLRSSDPAIERIVATAWSAIAPAGRRQAA